MFTDRIAGKNENCESKWWDGLSISLACNRIQELKAKQYVSAELTFEPCTDKFSAGWAFVMLN